MIDKNCPTFAQPIGAKQEYIKRVTSKGYIFKYNQLNGDGFGFDLEIGVFLNKIQIAYAQFADNEIDVHCQNIDVEKEHRRQGIATATYLIAEHLLRKTIYDQWKHDRIKRPGLFKDSEAFWNQKNRPFGRS